MLGTLKINTALFICSAFIFKFLFLNIGSLHSHSTENYNLLKNRLSKVIDTQKHFEPVDASQAYECLTTDFFEEDSNDTEQFKCHALLPVLVLYALLSGDVKSTPEKITPCPQHFAYTSSHRYLLLRTFRI